MKRRTFEQGLQMVEALKRKPHTFKQLSELTGLTQTSVERWFRAEVRKHCHVADYHEDARGRLFVPMWKWGQSEDTPRPGPQYSPAERMRNLRLRRSNPDLY